MGTEISRSGGYGFRGTVTAGDGSKKKGGEIGAGYVNLQGKEKAAEEGGTQRGRIQLEPSENSDLRLGITQHPCDNPHAIFVLQPSAADL